MPALRAPALLVEYESTRDLRIEQPDGGWICRPTPPPGGSWFIVDDDGHDRRTRWRRVRLVEGEPAVGGGRRA